MHFSFVKAFPNNINYASTVSAHELGHIWGLTHCSAEYPCPGYTMNGVVSQTDKFHPQNIYLINFASEDLTDNCVLAPDATCYTPPGFPAEDPANYPTPQDSNKLCEDIWPGSDWNWNSDGCGQGYCKDGVKKYSWFQVYDFCESIGTSGAMVRSFY